MEMNEGQEDAKLRVLVGSNEICKGRSVVLLLIAIRLGFCVEEIAVLFCEHSAGSCWMKNAMRSLSFRGCCYEHYATGCWLLLEELRRVEESTGLIGLAKRERVR